jgi:hypothetical protein
MILSRGTTAATDDQAPATAKITSPEKRIAFFVKRLLTVHHHTESLTTATKAHRKRFRVTLNQRSLSLSLAYFHQIIACLC